MQTAGHCMCADSDCCFLMCHKITAQIAWWNLATSGTCINQEKPQVRIPIEIPRILATIPMIEAEPVAQAYTQTSMAAYLQPDMDLFIDQLAIMATLEVRA